MSCRGALFAIEQSDVDALLAMNTEADRIAHVTDVIEERDLDGPWGVETDKAWDAIHRCFEDGNLTCDGGEYPLNHMIMAGKHLCTSGDYYISLKTPEQVKDIASKIEAVNETELRARYRRIDPDQYGMDLSDDDEKYTWDWFVGIAEFYKRAAAAGRWVIFTVDQ